MSGTMTHVERALVSTAFALPALVEGFLLAVIRQALRDDFFDPSIVAFICPFLFLPAYVGRLIRMEVSGSFMANLLLLPLPLVLLPLYMEMPFSEMPDDTVLLLFVPYGLFLLGLFAGPAERQRKMTGKTYAHYLFMAVDATAMLALCLGCMTAPLLLVCAWDLYASSSTKVKIFLSGPLGLSGLFVALECGRWLASRAPSPSSFAARYLPLLLPPLLFLSLGFYFMHAFSSESFLLFEAATLAFLLIYGLFLFAFRREDRYRKPARGRRVGVVCLLLVIAPFCVAYAVKFASLASGNYSSVHDAAPSLEWEFAQKYFPREEDNALALPAAPPSLRLGASPYRLDGTLAALPLYAAALQALTCLDEDGRLLSWRERKERLTRERVDYSPRYDIQRLADGEIDLLFGPPLSERQLDALRARGLTPDVRPVAREALVFFVQKDDPARSLSSEQLRRIYTGEITNWKEVGGRDERILPFQHEAEDENQLALEELILRGAAAVAPPREDYLPFMYSIPPSTRVARYRKRAGALGFGLRWYLDKWFPDGDVRPLAVDGVPPTDASLRDGSYPLIVPLCLIACRPLDDDSRAFRDWLLGPEGRDLIRRAGYLPWDEKSDGNAGNGGDTAAHESRGDNGDAEEER
ncbi:substrate-binding domain-containing protein [uncultured Desulfovibrio sp.]|uniref:substrate-binding domain-containing protein n=1 Tax=uncultured Desulfovibrio sp. TaxID=167968 RepID=UPI002602C4BD|nr:substrate-binding domain-containing protein [uncultured Desulfovibrio sp.]